MSINNILSTFGFIGPPAVAQEIGSVRPSFRLFVSFIGIGLLVFSETQHVLGVRIQLCVTEPDFFGKKSPLGKNDQKWSIIAQNWVFGLLNKIMLLVFSGICVKRKFLWFINILRNLHLGKIWFSSQPKIVLSNEISVFFNHQYFAKI